MINIDIICVGELRTKILREAEKDILKRINKDYKINIIQVQDEKNININRISEIEKIKNIEAEKILKKIKKNYYVISFEIEAKRLENISLKNIIRQIQEQNVCFIIGGSLGLSKKVSNLANKKISISNMTFPHQLMRLIVLEQFVD